MRKTLCGIALLALMAFLGISFGLSYVYGQEPDKAARGRFAYSVEVDLPRFDNPAIDGAVKQWLLGLVEPAGKCLEEFADADILEKGGWELSVKHELTKPSANVVSVVFTRHEFPVGAAHPSGGIQALSFDLASGKQLGLFDLFADPRKALEILADRSPALVAEIIKTTHPGAFPEGVLDTAWFKDGFDPEPGNYDSLGLEPEGVRVYFQQYQILPYVFGMPAPLIPLEALRPAGPNPAIWPEK